jgi:aspartate-semialdehyde dehydrogenase
MEPDVPLLIPGINAAHLPLIDQQRKRRGWRGYVAPIPNCTTTGLAITLKPVLDAFGLQSVLMVSMQSLSGAGRRPGVLALDILDNVIPYIPKEEEKVRREVGKILGTLADGTVTPAKMQLGATCTRVNVRDGHTEAVFASTQAAASAEQVRCAMAGFAGDLAGLALPSAPIAPIVLRDDPFRPQPRLDRDTDRGMATVVGRVESHDALPNGLKWVLVSHNTRMGAARGAVLTGELLAKRGYI